MLELDNLGFWLNWNRKLFIQINLGKLHIGSHFNVCKYCCKASTRQIKFCNLQGHCDLWIVIVSKTLKWDYVHWAPTKKSNCQGHFICSKLEGQHAKHFKQLCCWKMCGWVGGWWEIVKVRAQIYPLLSALGTLTGGSWILRHSDERGEDRVVCGIAPDMRISGEEVMKGGRCWLTWQSGGRHQVGLPPASHRPLPA